MADSVIFQKLISDPIFYSNYWMSSAIEYLETFSLQCISKDLPTDPDASVELHQYIRQILTSNFASYLQNERAFLL